MALTNIPPEVFSVITDYLRDENYELLYQTGCKILINLLSRSVKRIDEVKNMHVRFTAIETVRTIDDAEHLDLFPKLTTIGLFYPPVSDHVLLIPKTITTIAITTTEPLTTFQVNSLPPSVTKLHITRFSINNDYIFREGYRYISLANVLSKHLYDILAFPSSATHITYRCNCKVEFNTNIESLNVSNFQSAAYTNLKSLSCVVLRYDTILPSTIEKLHADMYSRKGGIAWRTTNDNLYDICHNISSLPRLTELNIPLPHELLSVLPKTLKKLTIEFVEYDSEHIDVSNMSLTNLYICNEITSPVILPKTLTNFRCNCMNIENIRGDCSNLTTLHINTNSIRVTLHDFNIYPSLTELCTTRTILLSTLPEKLAYLTCNSMIDDPLSDYTHNLLSLKITSIHKDTLDVLKVKLKYCIFEVKNILEPVHTRLGGILEKIPHMTTIDIRKLIIKVQWCELLAYDVIKLIEISKHITEHSIAHNICTVLSDADIRYIARNM